MAKEVIFTGTVPNDGTGDSIRLSFTRTNNNFTELYNFKSNTEAFIDSLDISIVQQANLVYDTAKAAFDNSNGAFNIANGAYNSANGNRTNTTVAFARVNAAYTIANAAFDQSNVSFVLANSAYNFANTFSTDLSSTRDLVNTASIISNNAFNAANNALPKAGGQITGPVRVTSNTNIDGNYYLFFGREELFGGPNQGGSDFGYIRLIDNDNIYGTGAGETATFLLGVDNDSSDSAQEDVVAIESSGDIYLNPNKYNVSSANVYVGTLSSRNVVWHSGNDGVDSGLDADTLDGQHATAFSPYSAFDIANAAFEYANTLAITANANIAIPYLISISNTANNAYVVTNTAFDKANAANVLAYNTGIGANDYTNSVSVSVNSYANSLITAAYGYINTSVSSANNYASSIGVSANDYSNTIVVSVNAYMNSVVTSANNYAGAMANSVKSYVDATYTTIANSDIIFNVSNSAFDLSNTVNTFAHGVSTNTTAAFGFANGVSTNTTAAFGFANGAATNAAAAFAHANTALQNTTGTFAGSLTVTGNTTVNGIAPNYAPNRPAFRVYGSGTTNDLTTTVNGSGCLTSNNWTVSFNQGTYLANTNGVFTAPVTGLYQVNIVARNSDYLGGISQLGVTKNGTSGGTVGGDCILMVEFAANSSMNHAGSSTIINLTAGDTLACKVLSGEINFDSNDNWSVAYIG